MSLPTPARPRRLARSALLAVLLSTVATGAFAAGKPDPRDAVIASLQAQLQELRDQQQANQQKIDALAGQLATVAGTTTDLQASTETLKAATDDNTASILTLKTPPATQATVVLSGGKPAMTSTDGRFSANIRAVGMFDTAWYKQDSAGPIATDLRRGAGAGDTAHARDLNSGTDFRRARFGVDGKVFGDFEYSFIYEFGGSGGEDAGHIHEAYAQYLGFKPFKIRVGAFEPLIGLAANGSTSSMPLMERPSPAEVARNVAAGDSRSALQVFGNGGFGNDSFNALWMVSGAVTGNTVGTINSTGSATTQPFGEQLAYIGRAAIAPFGGSEWLVHIGIDGSYVARPNDAGPSDVTGATVGTAVQFRDRPELRVDGTRLIDTGSINAKHAYEVGVELAGQYQSFYGAAEYFKYGVERRDSVLSDPDFHGWYVEGSWILTGERRKYNVANGAFDGPSPLYPFNVDDKTYGAFELAGRYSDLDLNYNAGAFGTAPAADAIRGGEQKIWTVGLNWYLNSAVRFMIEAQDVKIDRLSPNAVTFATPVGAQVGQHYNTVAVRSQVAF